MLAIGFPLTGVGRFYLTTFSGLAGLIIRHVAVGLGMGLTAGSLHNGSIVISALPPGMALITTLMVSQLGAATDQAKSSIGHTMESTVVSYLAAHTQPAPLLHSYMRAMAAAQA